MEKTAAAFPARRFVGAVKSSQHQVQEPHSYISPARVRQMNEAGWCRKRQHCRPSSSNQERLNRVFFLSCRSFIDSLPCRPCASLWRTKALQCQAKDITLTCKHVIYDAIYDQAECLAKPASCISIAKSASTWPSGTARSKPFEIME